MAKKVYVKPGGKATGKMKDYAIGSKERYNEYNERGWAQDRTSSGGGMTDVKKIGVAGVAAPGSIKMTGPTAGEKMTASTTAAAKTTTAASKTKQNVKDAKNQKKTVKAINKATKNIKNTDKGQTGTVENKEGQTSTAKQRMQLKAGARMLKNNLNAAAKKQNKETKKTKSTVPTINKKKNINYSGM